MRGPLAKMQYSRQAQLETVRAAGLRRSAGMTANPVLSVSLAALA